MVTPSTARKNKYTIVHGISVDSVPLIPTRVRTLLAKILYHLYVALMSCTVSGHHRTSINIVGLNLVEVLSEEQVS